MNVTTLTEKALKLGYKVVVDGGEITRVIPVNQEGEGRYTPDLSYPMEWDSESSWKIQTTSYGAKTSEEIDALMKGLKRGQKMVALLTEWQS